MTDQKRLAQKIAQVVMAVEEVEKKGHNDHFNYDYATAEDILRLLRRPLAEQNVSLMPSLSLIEEREYTTSGGKASVITTAHVDFTFSDGDSGEMFKCCWAGQGDDPADKGLGKAYTNAVKTFLRQAFLLPQGDDPEADASTDERAKERKSGSTSRRTASGAPKPSDGQVKLISDLTTQKGLVVPQLEVMASEAAGKPVTVEEGWVKANLTGGREGTASALIDRLMKGPYPKVESIPTPDSDVPSGEVPTHAPQDPGPDIPWEANAA